MTLNAGLEMRKSASLKGRVEGAAFVATPSQGIQWVDKWYPQIVATKEWADAWAKAPTQNPDGSKTDPGARGDVITDAMITSAVQALIGQQAKDADAEQTAQDQRIAELEQKVADLQKVIEQGAQLTPASEPDAAQIETN
jgi:hypothetical protein